MDKPITAGRLSAGAWTGVAVLGVTIIARFNALVDEPIAAATSAQTASLSSVLPSSQDSSITASVSSVLPSSQASTS